MISKFPYFPTMYPGESLYSVIARYHKNSIGTTLKGTIEDVFGTRTVSVSLEFPSHLKYLSNKLCDPEINEDILLYEHTIYPFYEPFIYEEEQNDIKQKMYFNGGGAIKSKIGFLAGSLLKKESFYVCPECIKEDIDKYGESYFRVVWQAQGYQVCHKHNVFLLPYPIKQSDVGRIKFIPLESDLIDCSCSACNENIEVLRMANMINDVLSGSLHKLNASKLKEIYLRRLKELDLLTVGDEVSYRRIIPLVRQYHGELLDVLDSEIDSNYESSWFRNIIRTKKIKIHPIRHLLYIMFLFNSLEQMKDYSLVREKTEVYPCLNKVCTSYNKNVIRKVVVTADSKTREKVGTFACPNCGYIYSRKMSEADKYKKGRVKDFGLLFMKELQNVVVKDELSLRGKAKYMGCDPKTVIKYSKLDKNSEYSDR